MTIEEGADEANDEVALKVNIWESSSADGIRPKATELGASKPMEQMEEHNYIWRSMHDHM